MADRTPRSYSLQALQRFGQTSQVDAYTRVDLYTEYKIDKTLERCLRRGENVLNEHYQEVFNFAPRVPPVMQDSMYIVDSEFPRASVMFGD